MLHILDIIRLFHRAIIISRQPKKHHFHIIYAIFVDKTKKKMCSCEDSKFPYKSYQLSGCGAEKKITKKSRKVCLDSLITALWLIAAHYCLIVIYLIKTPQMCLKSPWELSSTPIGRIQNYDSFSKLINYHFLNTGESLN